MGWTPRGQRVEENVKRSDFKLKKVAGRWGIYMKSTGIWVVRPSFEEEEMAQIYRRRLEFAFQEGMRFQFEESNKQAQKLMEKFGI